MARLDDSERALWTLTGQVSQLREAALILQKVLVVLARRQGGILVLDREELDAVPLDAVLRRADKPDGRVIIRVERSEQPESGSAG